MAAPLPDLGGLVAMALALTPATAKVSESPAALKAPEGLPTCQATSVTPCYVITETAATFAVLAPTAVLTERLLFVKTLVPK